jgi:dTMP kinase
MSTIAQYRNISAAEDSGGMSRRGKFITLEGVDGAGKSTHIEFIADAVVAASGRHAIVTREPGGTDLAERLRETILTHSMDPLAEMLLLVAARADHVARVIRPAMEAGSWVVCDRFFDATLAYQGAGKGVPLDLIERLGEAAHPGLRPDRTLVFDCSYEVARQRLSASGRKLDRFEREDQAFFERVRSAYLSRAKAEPERIRVIDATADVVKIKKSLEQALVFS